MPGDVKCALLSTAVSVADGALRCVRRLCLEPSPEPPSWLCVAGWNRLRVDLTSHARDGLTENDFIVAAKIDAIPKEDLLRKRRKTLPDA